MFWEPVLVAITQTMEAMRCRTCVGGLKAHTSSLFVANRVGDSWNPGLKKGTTRGNLGELFPRIPAGGARHVTFFFFDRFILRFMRRQLRPRPALNLPQPLSIPASACIYEEFMRDMRRAGGGASRYAVAKSAGPYRGMAWGEC